jgi:hypothetical protein
MSFGYLISFSPTSRSSVQRKLRKRFVSAILPTQSPLKLTRASSINAVLDLETIAVDTQFTATRESREVVERLLDADRWMIVRNVVTNVLHWDLVGFHSKFYSGCSLIPFPSLCSDVLFRYPSSISSQTFPLVNMPVLSSYVIRATASIKLSLNRIEGLGKKWSSTSMVEFAKSLASESSTANIGNVVGNRMFYASDYMVRGSGLKSDMVHKRLILGTSWPKLCFDSQDVFVKNTKY